MPLDLLTPNRRTLRPQELPAVEVPGLYVHIPFCAHKCHYCDFYSITRQPMQRMERFVELLLREADIWSQREERSQGPLLRPFLLPRTVFFGGGTPTLLPPPLMQRLIAGLRDRFDFSLVNEFTVEANPATVDRAYCDALLEAGVTRLSFGAQSFNTTELHLLERHHNPDDVPRSVDTARAAGFKRLNIDLIYAIPGQSFESWCGSLESALSLGLSHLSCYGLTYEPNTPITVRKRLGQFQPAAESLELEMFHHTRNRLTAAGLAPYEISNFAAPGEPCRHNLLYWHGGSYIGLGPSAASHVEGFRFKNRPHLGEWERSIEAAQLPATDIESLTPRQRAGELVMLALRLPEGIRFDTITRLTKLDPRDLFRDQLAKLHHHALLDITPDRFRLTPKALDIADAVSAEFVQ